MELPVCLKGHRYGLFGKAVRAVRRSSGIKDWIYIEFIHSYVLLVRSCMEFIIQKSVEKARNILYNENMW